MRFSEVFDEYTQTWIVYMVHGAPGQQWREPWVEIRPSTIAGAGNGVFALRDFEPNAIIGYYTGAYSLARKSHGNGEYALEVTAHRVIDGTRCGNWTMMMNDGAHGRRRRPRVNIEFDEEAAIRTLEPIRTGDELLVDYGAEYWEARSEWCSSA